MVTDPNSQDSNVPLYGGRISSTNAYGTITIKNELYEPEIGKFLRRILTAQDETKKLIEEMKQRYEVVVDRTLFGDQPILGEPNCKTQLGQELWQALQNQKQINTLLEIIITSCEL